MTYLQIMNTLLSTIINNEKNYIYYGNRLMTIEKYQGKNFIEYYIYDVEGEELSGIDIYDYLELTSKDRLLEEGFTFHFNFDDNNYHSQLEYLNRLINNIMEDLGI